MLSGRGGYFSHSRGASRHVKMCFHGDNEISVFAINCRSLHASMLPYKVRKMTEQDLSSQKITTEGRGTKFRREILKYSREKIAKKTRKKCWAWQPTVCILNYPFFPLLLGGCYCLYFPPLCALYTVQCFSSTKRTLALVDWCGLAD